MLLAVCHSDKGWSKVDDLGELSELRERTGNLLWAEADVKDLTEEDIDLIAEEFGLDELAVEDATAPRQRPKLEPYSNHLFITLHQLDESEGHLEPKQLGLFIGKQFVLTIHHGTERTINGAKDRWREMSPQLKTSGPAHLIHTIVDVIVDEYQAYADGLEDEIEQLEDIALQDPHIPIQRQLYSVKQRASRLRRFALPVGRVIEDLVDVDEMKDYMPDDTKNLYRDVADHVIRMTAQLNNVDALTQAVLELVRGGQSEALQVQGRKLSAWAAIFGVGTLIAGIYGMNFALIPEDQTLGGFWFALGLMAVTGLGMYAYFKKRDWL